MNNVFFNFDEVKQLSLNNVEKILDAILPGGKYIKSEYIALNPKRCDKNLGSFRINTKKGVWKDFAIDEDGGDIIGLVGYICNLNYYEASKKVLNICNGYSNFNYMPSKASKPSKVNNLVQAKKIWNETNSAKNSLVEKYLNARGINTGPVFSIRFHPNLYHAESKQKFPAMVCAIQIWPGYELAGIHRTYLKPDGNGKADINNNKMMLGNTKGGGVRFGQLSKQLIIAEGIETALSIYQISGITTWAALSTSGMKSLVLPTNSITEEIIIAADNDYPGINAAEESANLWTKQGWNIKIIYPSSGFKDFNDMIKGEKSHGK